MQAWKKSAERSTRIHIMLPNLMSLHRLKNENVYAFHKQHKPWVLGNCALCVCVFVPQRWRGSAIPACTMSSQRGGWNWGGATGWGNSTAPCWTGGSLRGGSGSWIALGMEGSGGVMAWRTSAAFGVKPRECSDSDKSLSLKRRRGKPWKSVKVGREGWREVTWSTTSRSRASAGKHTRKDSPEGRRICNTDKNLH